MIKKRRPFIFLFILLYLMSSAAFSQNLDLSFGNGTGKLLIPIENEDRCHAVAVQQNGKIILGGGSSYGSSGFSIVRLNTDGTFDNSFNAVGKKVFSILSTGSSIMSLKLSSNDEIITGGNTFEPLKSFYGIANLNGGGSFNTSFNSTGQDTLSIDSINHLSTLTCMDVSNANILLAGYSGSSAVFSVAVLKMDGSLDHSFNTTGKLLLPSAAGTMCYASLFQKDGKILLAGTNNNDFVIIRLNANGTFDNTFGLGTGQVTVDFGGSQDYAYSLVQQKNGKILAGGKAGGSMALVRLNTNGSLDNAFGPDLNGKISTGFGTSYTSICNSVAIDTFATNNKIILAGYGYKLDGHYGGFGTIRLDLNGNIEAVSIIPMGTTNISEAKGVAIQPDSKIILAGYANNGIDNDFAVIRLLPDFVTTGISEAEATVNAGVNIFPNPASYQLNIHSRYNISNIIIYNVLGEQVMSVANNNDMSSVIDISSLNKGIYTAVIITDKGNAVKKVVKQ